MKFMTKTASHAAEGLRRELYSVTKLGAHTKRAGGVLHALGTALGGHLSTNLVGRQGHHHSNLNEMLAHQGFQHGLTGAGLQIHPGRVQAIKSLLGPEVMIPYEQARQQGAKLLEKYPEPVARRAAIRSAHEMGQSATLLPVYKDIHRAMGHELAGTTPELQADNRVAKMYGRAVGYLTRPTTSEINTPAQRAVGYATGLAPLAAMGAADAAASGGVPLGAVGHLGWNAVRQGAMMTPLGKHIATSEIREGLKGNRLSRAQELAVDHLASPAYLDIRRAGLIMHDTDPGHALALADNPALPQVLENLKDPEGAAERARNLAEATGHATHLGQAFAQRMGPLADPDRFEAAMRAAQEARLDPAFSKYLADPNVQKLLNLAATKSQYANPVLSFAAQEALRQPSDFAASKYVADPTVNRALNQVAAAGNSPPPR